MHGQKKQQRGAMFFDQFVRDYGEDFISKVPPLTIAKKSHMFFRDIAMGNIDLKKYGKYFSPQFVDLMEKEAFKKRFYYGTHVNGLSLTLQYLPQNAQHPLFNVIEKEDRYSLAAYDIIDEGLRYILNSGDLNHILTMVNNIKPYKYSL